MTGMKNKVQKAEEEWKKQLTPEQYEVCRNKGTERPFTGEYYQSKEPGIYKCVACGNELFDSNTKFDSGTGWPSFYKPLSEENVDADPPLPAAPPSLPCASPPPAHSTCYTRSKDKHNYKKN